MHGRLYNGELTIHYQNSTELHKNLLDFRFFILANKHSDIHVDLALVFFLGGTVCL
jgi:hypothetical protein